MVISLLLYRCQVQNVQAIRHAHNEEKGAYAMCQSCLHAAIGARDTVRRARKDTSSTSCNDKKSQIKGVVLF